MVALADAPDLFSGGCSGLIPPIVSAWLRVVTLAMVFCMMGFSPGYPHFTIRDVFYYICSL